AAEATRARAPTSSRHQSRRPRLHHQSSSPHSHENRPPDRDPPCPPGQPVPGVALLTSEPPIEAPPSPWAGGRFAQYPSRPAASPTRVRPAPRDGPTAFGSVQQV